MSDTGAELIYAERQRQIEKEGWTAERDDVVHADGGLAAAAVCYIKHDGEWPFPLRSDRSPLGWPWDSEWWKPKDRISNLVRAGALIAAEIDRLQRMKENSDE